MTNDTHFYVVDGYRGDHIVGQWVIAATSEDEACTIAERRQAGVADFDIFTAEKDTDRLFDAEDNLTEELPECGPECVDCERSYGPGICPASCDCECHDHSDDPRGRQDED